MYEYTSAFATIVSLIGQYRQERGAAELAGYTEFLQWLVETQHEEVRHSLETNTRLCVGIKALLKENYDLLLARLESLDQAFASFASNLDGFSNIVDALKPNARLSTQALNILLALEQSGGSKFLEVNSSDEAELLVLDGNINKIVLNEERFVKDDLKTLVELGLLRHEFNKNHDNIYVFTRAAWHLIQRKITFAKYKLMIDEQAANPVPLVFTPESHDLELYEEMVREGLLTRDYLPGNYRLAKKDVHEVQ